MGNVSFIRLYLLRAVYLLIAVGLGVQMWPKLVYGDVAAMGLQLGTVTCMLWAMSVLALLGIRYPLQMLPLIFFEMLWKATWLLAVALPRWSHDQLTAGFTDTAVACLMGVIFPVVVPWRYVFEHYVKRAGDPWRGHAL